LAESGVVAEKELETAADRLAIDRRKLNAAVSGPADCATADT